MGFENNEKMVGEIARVICAWWVSIIIKNQKNLKNKNINLISQGQKDKFSSVFSKLLQEVLKKQLSFSTSSSYKENLFLIKNFGKIDILLLAALEEAHINKNVLPKNCFSIVNLGVENSKITNFVESTNEDYETNLQEVIILKKLD